MPRFKLSQAHFDAIREAQRAGKSMRALALEIGVERRTLDRAAKRLSRVAKPAGRAPSASSELTGADEHVATLRATAERLRGLVEADLPPRDVTAAARELRETLAAIRRIEAPPVTPEDTDISEGAANVIARLRRMAEANDRARETREAALRCAHCPPPGEHDAAHLHPTGTDPR